MLCWPDVHGGMVGVCRTGKDTNHLVAFCPYFERGIETQVRLSRVLVQDNGLEAQVEGAQGGAPVTFYDVAYCIVAVGTRPASISIHPARHRLPGPTIRNGLDSVHAEFRSGRVGSRDRREARGIRPRDAVDVEPDRHGDADTDARMG
ncbi:MAG: hypothetical protein U1F23_08070 [Lysobacterales bacterium]